MEDGGQNPMHDEKIPSIKKALGAAEEEGNR